MGDPRLPPATQACLQPPPPGLTPCPLLHNVSRGVIFCEYFTTNLRLLYHVLVCMSVFVETYLPNFINLVFATMRVHVFLPLCNTMF